MKTLLAVILLIASLNASADALQDLQDLERRKEQQDEYIMRQGQILDMRHADWREVISSKEYDQWGKTLPLHVQKSLSRSLDGEYISAAITAFKEYQLKNATTKKGVNYEKF